MNIVIREALEYGIGLANARRYETGKDHSMVIRSFQDALAELDKAQQPGKVLTDEEIERITLERVASLADTETGKLITNTCREFYRDALRHARDNGYLAPAAVLTVEEIDNALAPVFQALDWGQTDHAYSLLSSVRNRLTAAYNAKAAKQ